jgi:hypothetical protein
MQTRRVIGLTHSYQPVDESSGWVVGRIQVFRANRALLQPANYASYPIIPNFFQELFFLFVIAQMESNFFLEECLHLELRTTNRVAAA